LSRYYVTLPKKIFETINKTDHSILSLMVNWSFIQSTTRARNMKQKRWRRLRGNRRIHNRETTIVPTALCIATLNKKITLLCPHG